jgi:hypothetical protein
VFTKVFLSRLRGQSLFSKVFLSRLRNKVCLKRFFCQDQDVRVCLKRVCMESGWDSLNVRRFKPINKRACYIGLTTTYRPDSLIDLHDCLGMLSTFYYISRPVAEFFIIGERFVVIAIRMQAAEVFSKLSTMSRSLSNFCSDH